MALVCARAHDLKESAKASSAKSMSCSGGEEHVQIAKAQTTIVELAMASSLSLIPASSVHILLSASHKVLISLIIDNIAGCTPLSDQVSLVP